VIFAVFVSQSTHRWTKTHLHGWPQLPEITRPVIVSQSGAESSVLWVPSLVLRDGMLLFSTEVRHKIGHDSPMANLQRIEVTRVGKYWMRMNVDTAVVTQERVLPADLPLVGLHPEFVKKMGPYVVWSIDEPSAEERRRAFETGVMILVEVDTAPFQSKSGMRSKPTPFAPQWTLANLMLLSGFSRDPAVEPHDSGVWADRWKVAVEESQIEAVRRFAEAGLLVPCSLSEHLVWKFSCLRLKQMLRERALKVSGRKSDLAERLSSADPKGGEEAITGLRMWKCSAEGMKLTNLFMELVRETEKAAYEALRSKKCEEAVQIVCDFKDALGFPQMQFFSDRPNLEDVRAVLNGRPGILAGISEEQLELLQIAAGMSSLLFDYHILQRLPEGFSTGLAFSNDTAIAMLCSYARIKRQLAQYRKMKIKNMKIENGNPKVCDVCKALVGTVFLIDEAPELPHLQCISPSGCHCFLSPVLPS
jgi:hypothetical protein